MSGGDTLSPEFKTRGDTMKKVYLMAAALMFTGAVFTAGVDAQQRDGSPERDSARDAEAKRSAVHKATIDGMM
jgi:hypothetical protein